MPTTILITDIGTQFTETFAINTHVESVTYSDPAVVAVTGFGEAYEIRGTVSGTGWGGVSSVARASNNHYRYNIPFVARWPKRGPNGPSGWSEDVVTFFHGGSSTVTQIVAREKLVGAANNHRIGELSGDRTHGFPALLNDCVYISTNRRGLRGDGTFSATYLPTEVPPLTATEAATLNAAIAAAPGVPNFVQPGLTAGAPVPLVPNTDVPTYRDISRALHQVVGGAVAATRTVNRVVNGEIQTKFRTRICAGTSSGARLGAALNFGRSALSATVSARTGGNHITPYDPASSRIFDGFILHGLPLEPSDRVDATQPISARTFCIIGRGDDRYQEPIHLGKELLDRGKELKDWLRIYEVKGLTHITRDSPETQPSPSHGDALGCFASAGIRNLGEWIRGEQDPPLSRIAGRIKNKVLVLDQPGASSTTTTTVPRSVLVFGQAGGSTTTNLPIVEDPAIDTVPANPQITPRTVGSAEQDRWLAVTAALPHENDAIVPPSIACRLGGYKLGFFGTELVPFPPSTLATMYGPAGFIGYKHLVKQVVAQLKMARLYDPRVESAEETAYLASGLFWNLHLLPPQYVIPPTSLIGPEPVSILGLLEPAKRDLVLGVLLSELGAGLGDGEVRRLLETAAMHLAREGLDRWTDGEPMDAVT